MNELQEFKLFLQRFLDNISYQFSTFAERAGARLETLEQKIKQLEQENKELKEKLKGEKE